jgi:hypothetical protein
MASSRQRERGSSRTEAAYNKNKKTGLFVDYFTSLCHSSDKLMFYVNDVTDSSNCLTSSFPLCFQFDVFHSLSYTYVTCFITCKTCSNCFNMRQDLKSSNIRMVCCRLRPPVCIQFHNMTCTFATKVLSLRRNYLQRRDEERHVMSLSSVPRRAVGCHPLSSPEFAVSFFSPFGSSLIFYPRREDTFIYLHKVM